MTDLDTRIKELDRGLAYEAAQLLAAELGADPDAQPIDHEVLTNPMTHQQDLEDLAKVLLLVTAEIDQDAVARAIEGAGHKQLILGGAELVILGILVVGGIQVIMSKGKTSEHVETVTTERHANGHEQTTISTRTTHYGISKGAASLLGQLQAPPSQPPPGPV
ncbi:hypothetical protein [Streptomyces luteogriseus]|uniref:hypothetical protein n=1 Tax=Streptomyces luteogriseus TaxID=68233 RepID=UPI0036740B4E